MLAHHERITAMWIVNM